MARHGPIIGLKPEATAEYKRVHAAVWPDVLKQIKASRISNYSIFLKEPENLLQSHTPRPPPLVKIFFT
jgi:L-rhamnose mutarotase